MCLSTKTATSELNQPALSNGPYNVVQLPRSVAGNSGSSLTRGNSEELEIQIYINKLQ
jgi:hypothetical protein